MGSFEWEGSNHIMRMNTLDYLISGITGQIYCDYNYILVGNAQGIAVPTPGVPIGALPDLTLNKTWVGDASNRPIEMPYIGDTTYVIRLPNTLLPSAQDLDSLYSLVDPTILKVVANGYLALAVADVDYATTTTLTNLANDAANSASAASASAAAASVSAAAALASELAAGTSATIATGEAVAAAGSAASAAISATNALNYYTTLTTTGLNAFTNSGDVDIAGYRVKNVNPQPGDNYDAITFDFTWALLNGKVIFTWS